MEKDLRTSKTKQTQAAKLYVDAQLKIMKEHGSAPTLSASAYQKLVKKVEKATKVPWAQT